MSNDDQGVDLDSVRTLAFSTVGPATGSEVARMLRLAAERIDEVGVQIQHVAAHTDDGPRGPVLHLRFFWIDAGADET